MLCPECQSLLQEDLTECPVCGVELPSEGDKAIAWHRDRRAHLMIAAVFLLIVGILYAVIAIDPESTEPIDPPPPVEEASPGPVVPEPEVPTVMEEVEEEAVPPEVLTDEDLIAERIHLFNDAWLAFVHTGSLEIEGHITADSDVYRVLRDFDRRGLEERFLLLDVGEITVTGERAVARVHEIIEKKRASEVWSDEYHWRYILRWEENTWLIERYVTDEM